MTDDFVVRRFRSADARALVALFERSVAEIGPSGYSPLQVAAWRARTPTPERLATLAADGRTFLVAEGVDGALLAFGDVEPDGHIHYLYAAPEAAGRGVAARLYAELESTARAQGTDRLYSEASEMARRFFERRGFVTLHRRDFTIGDGVPIHNYAVEKRLSTSPESASD